MDMKELRRQIKNRDCQNGPKKKQIQPQLTFE